MATNPFNRGMNVAADLAPVTPNDSTDLPEYGRGIRVRPDGAAGTVHFRNNAGVERTTAMAAGETILVGVTRIYATGTTATGIEVLI